MKLYEIMQNLFSVSVEPEIYLNAVKNQAKNAQLRSELVKNQVAEGITVGDSTLITEDLAIETDGSILSCKEIFTKVIDQNKDLDDTVTVIDYSTGLPIDINVEKALMLMTEEADSSKDLYNLTSILSNASTYGNVSPTDILGELRSLGYEINDYDAAYQLAYSFSDALVSGEEKIKTFNAFTGLSKFLSHEETDTINDTTIDMANYTGVSPLYAMCGSIVDAFAQFGKGVANTIVAAATIAVEVTKKLVKTAWKGLKKAFKWCKKKIVKTFVNPTDIKTSGEFFEFFDVFNRTHEGPADGQNFMVNQFMKDYPTLRSIMSTTGVIRLSFLNVIWIITLDSDRNVFVVTKYIKPINYTEVLAKAAALGYGSQSNNLSASMKSYDGLIKLCEIMNNSGDFPSTTSEKIIYNSLERTRAISSAILYKMSMDIGRKGIDYEVNENTLHPSSASDPYHLFRLINDIWACITIPVDDSSLSGEYGIGFGDLETSNVYEVKFFQKQTVSNIDFFKSLTATYLYLTTSYSLEYVDAQTETMNPEYGMGFLNYSGTSAIVCDRFVLSMIERLVACTEDVNHELWNEVIVPYDHIGSCSINSSIKTDDENVESASRAMIGALITIALTAVAVKVAPKIIKAKKVLKVKAMEVSTNEFRIGELMADGNKEEAMALLKQTNKTKRLLKITGMSSEEANGLVSSMVASSGTTDVNTKEILALIR